MGLFDRNPSTGGLISPVSPQGNGGVEGGGGGGGGGANTALSNLAATAVNVDLNPGADGTLSLGTPTNKWLELDTHGVYIEDAANPYSVWAVGGNVKLNINYTTTPETNQGLTGSSIISRESGGNLLIRTTVSLADINIASNQDINLSSAGLIKTYSTFVPSTPGTISLGASGAEFLDIYVDNVYSSGNCGVKIIDVLNGTYNDNVGVASINSFTRKLINASGSDLVDFGFTNNDTFELLSAAKRFKVDTTVTSAGTTGAQTINKMSGTVNFAAAASSLVVTNSAVGASSIVLAVIRTNDTTMTSVQVVPSSGSFTIYANAPATAETSVGFFILNG